MQRSRVGVVGAGRVGAVLAARLRAAGHEIVGVSGRSDATRLRVATLLGDIPLTTPESLLPSVDLLVLAVPDDSLAEVADRLAPLSRPGQYVVHTSGRHGRVVLAPFADRGARTAAVHPAMTFTGTEIDLDRTCVFGLTAADEDREAIAAFVADLGGSPMWIAESDRVAYHAALAHGANHLTTLVTQAMDVLRGIGADDPASVLRPLLGAALDNTLAYGDAALTGPVARGDVDTVHAHLEALDGDTRRTYRALAESTAERAQVTGRIGAVPARRLHELLGEESVR
ncbi:glycerol-3-phosphate dehydrogenase [Aeromicrobium sp. PE09-221]|nr:glycerol-3-phosphate dehydrogenase [Aeromicrobium sp. PE09-221]